MPGRSLETTIESGIDGSVNKLREMWKNWKGPESSPVMVKLSKDYPGIITWRE